MKKKLLALFGVALLVKIILLAAFFWPDGCLEGRVGYDDIDYFEMARTLVDDGMLAYPSHPGQPSVFRTPGYPLFLAATGVVAGWNVFCMQLFQAGICSLAPVLLFFVLRQLKAPVWPAWILVFDPLTNLLAVTFMTEGLLILFLLASLYCFLRAKENGRFLFFGLLLWSLSILIKPSGQFFYFVLPGMLLIFKFDWKRVVLLALLAFTPVLGWMARNERVCGTFCVSTQKDNVILAKIATQAKGNRAEIGRLTAEKSAEHATDGGVDQSHNRQQD